MGNFEKRRRNRISLAGGLRMRKKISPLITAAEFYLAVGTVVHFAVGRGIPLHQVCRRLGLPTSACLLAREYANSPDWLKLRALVEDWSWDEIKEKVRRGHENYTIGNVS